METISSYEQQAIDFLNQTGASIDIKFNRSGKHFADDKEDRDIYTITIKRGSRKFSFDFGQSINKSGFYYTKGRQIIPLDRSKLNDINLSSFIKKNDHYFLDNGKSDIIHRPEAPSYYDVLACLQKYDIGSFDDFCSEFGYDIDSRQPDKTYKAICKEYDNICRLFTDEEIELMQEIQ